MSIILDGRKFQTLEQPICVNGKLLKEARVNGQIVYPTETYGNFAHFGYIRGVGEYTKQVYFMTDKVPIGYKDSRPLLLYPDKTHPVTMRVRYAYCWLFDHRKTLGLPKTDWGIFHADSASAYIEERDGKKNLRGGAVRESYWGDTRLPGISRSIPGLFNDKTMKAASVVLKVKLEFSENPFAYGTLLYPVSRVSPYPNYRIARGDDTDDLINSLDAMKKQRVYTFAYVSSDADLHISYGPLVGSLRNNRTFPIVGMVGDSDVLYPTRNDSTASNIHFAQGPLGRMNCVPENAYSPRTPNVYMCDYFSYSPTTFDIIDKETARIPIGDAADTNVTHTTQPIMDVSPVWVYLYKNEKHGLTTPELAYAHVDDVPDF